MVYDDAGDYTVPVPVAAARWHGMVAMTAGGAGGGDGVGVGRGWQWPWRAGAGGGMNYKNDGRIISKAFWSKAPESRFRTESASADNSLVYDPLVIRRPHLRRWECGQIIMLLQGSNVLNL